MEDGLDLSAHKPLPPQGVHAGGQSAVDVPGQGGSRLVTGLIHTQYIQFPDYPTVLNRCALPILHSFYILPSHIWLCPRLHACLGSARLTSRHSFELKAMHTRDECGWFMQACRATGPPASMEVLQPPTPVHMGTTKSPQGTLIAISIK